MILLYLVLMIFSIIYLVDSFFIVYLNCKKLFNKSLFFFCSICFFLLILLGGIAVIDRNRFKSELEQKPEKYELVNKQFYRKVK